MDEQKIVEYLKKNKETGIAFGFMPKEVKEWCSKNDSNLVYYSVNGTWFSNDKRSMFDMNEIVALPDSFIQQEEKGEWVECEIKKNGCFFVNNHYYHWSEWTACLINNNDNFIAFGGWQYKDNKGWFTTPQVEIENGYLSDNYCLEVKPAIPTKIRFYRRETK